MVKEPLICLFRKCVLCVIFGVKAKYTKIPILYAVTCFMHGGSCLANSFPGVNTGIFNLLCMSIANNVSLGEMAYYLGVTVSKKNPSLRTRWNTQSRSSLEPARAARTKKRGGYPPRTGGGGNEVSNLDPLSILWGPYFFYQDFSVFT